MKELALFIEQAGKKSRIRLLLQRTFGEENSSNACRRIFMGTGDYGKVICTEFRTGLGSLHLIRFALKREILLSHRVKSGSILLNFCIRGIFRFKGVGKKDQLLATSQGKIRNGERSEISYCVIGPTENKEYTLLNLTVFPEFSGGESSKNISLIPISPWRLKSLSDSASEPFNSSIDILRNLDEIKNELGQNRPDKLKLEAYSLLILLAAQDLSEKRAFSESIQMEWNPDERLVFMLAESIILGMDESWSLEKLANSRLLNRNKVKILFKKYMGMPAAKFKISVRMKKAQQLLVDTPLSIQDISFQVGYPNAAHFSTLFRRKMGCSPSSIRKMKGCNKKLLQ